MQSPLLLGHRGVRGNRSTPENSIAAFDLAMAQGCDGFEFDVRLTADRQAVICHDAKVRGLTIVESSSQIFALPLLREVLQRYRKSAFLDIELKVAGIENTTLELLTMYPPVRGYVVSSFLPEVLKSIHLKDATIPLGLICETKAQFAEWIRLPVQYVIPYHKLIRQNIVAELKGEGRRVLIWTVNSTADMKRFAEWEVDGIISDDPRKLVATVAKKQDHELY